MGRLSAPSPPPSPAIVDKPGADGRCVDRVDHGDVHGWLFGVVRRCATTTPAPFTSGRAQQWRQNGVAASVGARTTPRALLGDSARAVPEEARFPGTCAPKRFGVSTVSKRADELPGRVHSGSSYLYVRPSYIFIPAVRITEYITVHVVVTGSRR